MDRIYMDHAATTPVNPDVLAAMLPFFTERFGNASSVYTEARTARAAVEKGLCTPETLPRLLAVLERYGLPTETDYPLTDILAAAEADKKRTDDVTKFIVPERVGHCRVEPVPADEVAGWLKAGGLR